MITNEPSQHVTPLSDEQAGFVVDQPVRTDVAVPPPPRTRPAWLQVLISFVIWLLSVAMLAFIPVVVALPYVIYKMVYVGPINPQALATDKTLIFLSILGILPSHVLTLGLVWLFVTEGRRRPFFDTIGFRWPRDTSPTYGTMLCILLALALLAIGWAVTTVWGGNKTQLDLMVESSMAARVVTALVAVVTAPLVEELIYRGVMYSALERAGGKIIAILVVSLLFAGVHVFQYSNNIAVIVVITILSFTLTFARAYTGSVVPPFIIHLVFNGIQSLFIVLAPFLDKDLLQKSEEITPTTPGLELPGRLFETIAAYVCRMT